MAFFAIGGLAQGFFFDWGLLGVGSLLLLAGAAYAWICSELRIAWIMVAVGIYALAYGLTIFYAVDVEHAAIEFGRVLLLVPLIGLFLTLDKKRYHAVQIGFTRVAMAISGIGILFGLERKERLESTLEYANVLAILMLVAIIISVLQYARDGKRRELIVTAICFGGLLLTQSRSVWVLWILVVALLIVLFREIRTNQRLAFITAAHTFGLIIACSYKQDLLFFKNRVQSILPETSEFKIRLTYWQDSIGMLKDYGWKGTGGGGWSLLQQDYQSKAYYVKFIHNHYLQTILDAGLLGLTGFMGIIAAFLWGVIRLWKNGEEEDRFWTKGMLVAVGALLLHAGFDFDLTFPLVTGLLLFLCARFAKEVPPALTIRRSSLKYIFVIVAFGLFAAMGWLAIGYQQKELAVQLRDRGQPAASLSEFGKATGLLPWSHTIRYEFGKAYVLIGNETQDRQAYRDALTEVKKAVQLAPRESLYKELLNDLKNMGNLVD